MQKNTFKNVDKPLLDKLIRHKLLIVTSETLHVLELTAWVSKARGWTFHFYQLVPPPPTSASSGAVSFFNMLTFTAHH